MEQLVQQAALVPLAKTVQQVQLDVLELLEMMAPLGL